MEYFEGIWRGADTIVVGRIAYEGFDLVWPAMTRDERTDPRTRDLGRWLDATEKVVVSRTLTDAPWEHSRIARDLAAEIERLRGAPGRDVLVINSATVIGELLRLRPDRRSAASRSSPSSWAAGSPVPGRRERALRDRRRHGARSRRDRRAPATDEGSSRLTCVVVDTRRQLGRQKC